MTDIIKLADDYANEPIDMYALDPRKYRDMYRADLQSAIEALQKEVSTLDVLLEECKMDWSGDVTQIKAEHKREIEALQAENERLQKLFLKDVRIKELGLTPNLHASFEGGPVRLMAECYADFFRSSEAPNYIEMQLCSEDGLELIATLQRKSGKTPHQLRQEAEAERDSLKSKVDAMGKGEPVQYQYRDAIDDGTWSAWVGCDKPLHPNTWRQVRELYAEPKALAPLTDEQIYNVFAATVEDAEPFSELVGDPIWAEVVEITRAIEAAHGIQKGGQHEDA